MKVKEANGTMNIPSIIRRRKFVNSRSLNDNNPIAVESDASACNHHERDFNVESYYFGLFNCRSVCNKAIILKDYIIERNFDILVITEIWSPRDIDRITIGNLIPNGCCFCHAPRESRSGSVGVKLKRTLMVVSTEYFTNYRYREKIN